MAMTEPVAANRTGPPSIGALPNLVLIGNAQRSTADA
jgi:hypothetical protein